MCFFFLVKVKWDGEWVKGTGKSTGEECEQVFSFLSRCANTTKYQIPESKFIIIFISLVIPSSTSSCFNVSIFTF